MPAQHQDKSGLFVSNRTNCTSFTTPNRPCLVSAVIYHIQSRWYQLHYQSRESHLQLEERDARSLQDTRSACIDWPCCVAMVKFKELIACVAQVSVKVRCTFWRRQVFRDNHLSNTIVVLVVPKCHKRCAQLLVTLALHT